MPENRLENNIELGLTIDTRGENQLALRDEELIERYQTTGCRDVLEALVDRHLLNVRRVIYSMVLDHAITDDLTQEVFLKAIRALNTFEGRAAFSTWLCRIAMNTANSYLARQSRSPVAFCAIVPDSEAGPSIAEQTLAQREFNDEIETALRSLSPKLRAAIVLTCLQGLTAQEAAGLEGCSTATMYWRIHQARKTLKHHLGKHLTYE